MPVKSSIDELADLQARTAISFSDRLLQLASALVVDRHPSAIAKERALARLSRLIGETMALSDLMGRRRLILEAEAVRARQPVSTRAVFSETPVVPHVEFDEAVADMVSRRPELAKSAEKVAEVYERHGFALAQAAELSIVKRIQEFIAKALREGRTVPKAAETIAGIGDFTQAYAETVYRTNVATAYTAGRFQQAADPDIAEVIGAFEFNAVLDADTRPNHAAAHGLLASQNDPIWATYSPPLGFQCRCDLRLVDRFELRERNLLDTAGRTLRILPGTFSSAYPDPGFGHGRPDRRIYGG